MNPGSILIEFSLEYNLFEKLSHGFGIIYFEQHCDGSSTTEFINVDTNAIKNTLNVLLSGRTSKSTVPFRK